MGLAEPSTITPLRLDERFSDADGDLVADSPKDPSQQVTPDQSVFAFIAGPEADQERANWKEFTDFLSKQIEKPVEMVAFKTTEEQIDALKKGKLHVAGFNTGAIPLAVNTAALCRCAPAAGAMANLATACRSSRRRKSAIRSQHLDDLRGHTLVFTDRTSNSGFKAAVVLLKEHGMELPRDYSWRFSTGHSTQLKASPPASTKWGRFARDAHSRRQPWRCRYEQAQSGVRIGTFPPGYAGIRYNLAPTWRRTLLRPFSNSTGPARVGKTVRRFRCDKVCAGFLQERFRADPPQCRIGAEPGRHADFDRAYDGADAPVQ